MKALPVAAPARASGMTLVEVLAAVAIVAIAIVVLSSVASTALRSAETTDARTQLASVVSFLGRDVVGGASRALPDVGGTLAWDYGALGEAFPDLEAGADGLVDVSAYRATIRSEGEVTVAGASAVRYRIESCVRTRGEERCLDAVTFGPAPLPSAAGQVLPGIN